MMHRTLRDTLTDVTIDAQIQLSHVEKTYSSGRVSFQALKEVNLTISTGELVAIVGPSGSGKTTIMNLIAGIDRPSAGTVVVNGSSLNEMNEEELSIWRGKNVGIVFQFFQLMPTLTAAENAVLPLDLARWGAKSERRKRAARHLERVGLGDHAKRLPSELSGGEQQRVAIARAMACEPMILLGDEPTGNLDSDTAQRMFALLQEQNRTGTTVVYVTHDRGLASLASRIVSVHDGRIVGDTRGDA